jgi:hypothetical protein
LAHAAPIVGNAGFETYSGGVQGFTPAQGPIIIGSPWVAAPTFGPLGSGGYEGISNKTVGGGLVGETAAPEGLASAFIEGQGQLSQTITGFTNAAQYTVSFYAEKYSGGATALQLLMDSTVLTFSSATSLTATSSTSFVQYTTDRFGVTAGSHTLTINGITLDGAGHITFIDSVAVNEFVPEPASLGVLTLGGLVLVRRRR